jgi:hypothetical protein
MRKGRNYAILNLFSLSTMNLSLMEKFFIRNSFKTFILFKDRSFFNLKNNTPLWDSLFLKIKIPKSLSFVIRTRSSRFAISSTDLSGIPLAESYTENTSCPSSMRKLATEGPVHSSTINFINYLCRQSVEGMRFYRLDCIGDTCFDIIMRKFSVFITNFRKRSSVMNQIQNEDYRKSGSFDNRFPIQYIFTGANSRLPIIFFNIHNMNSSMKTISVNHISQGAKP